jgi:hypothetical protein
MLGSSQPDKPVMSEVRMPARSNRNPARPVRYHLRATLTPECHEAEEQALWSVLKRGRFDEVMFFVPHAEERSDGLGTDEDNTRMAEILSPLFARLRKAGIAPSINIWWTAAFSEFPGMPRDLRNRFNFRWAVRPDGYTSRSVACPRCPDWRRQIAAMYRTYAALKPVRLWIDDDVRTTLRADMHSPCFCDVCLAAIAARLGAGIARSGLLAGILADPPNPVRDAWLADQRDLMREMVAFLADAVHEVSSGTSVSLMHSCPEQHAAEGRCWADLVAALGTPPPMLRPGIGTYAESTGPGFAAALAHARRSLAAYPPGIAVAPEIETYPQSRYGKSLASAAADLVLAQLLGAREMTFSIYRFGGRLDLEIAREDAWSDMLARLKPKLQALADLDIRPDQQRGIGLVWREDEARHAWGVHDQPKPIFLFRQHPWDHVLPLLGLAAAHAPARVTALSGEQPESLTPPELDRLASGGLLLDARAAEAFLRMGRGNLVGIARRLPDTTATREMIEDPAFGGFAGDVINCRWTSAAWQFETLPGARVVSRLRGYRGEERGHGVLAFENRLGGRVVIVPFDSQVAQVSALGIGHPPFESPSFLCRPRQAQMRDALVWAGSGPLPLTVEDAPMVYPLLIEQPGRLVIGIVNLMPDPVPLLTIRLASPAFEPRRIRLLTPSGRWRMGRQAAIARDPADHAVVIRLPLPLPYLETGVLLLD